MTILHWLHFLTVLLPISNDKPLERLEISAETEVVTVSPDETQYILVCPLHLNGLSRLLVHFQAQFDVLTVLGVPPDVIKNILYLKKALVWKQLNEDITIYETD